MATIVCGVVALAGTEPLSATTLFPHVTAIDDASTSSLSGGTPVHIEGHGFTGATSVDFGTLAASSFTVEDDDDIVATAPASSTAGPVEITVTTDSGTSSRNPGDVFTYVNVPLLSRNLGVNADDLA
ncbi:MAG TPA: IPT/TIG domain-containing protein, partial [Acidimicrobiales bacterium]|nr:IPT/TIG domain-containing protein [Acidimicrobiales bacterium]